MRFSEFGLTTLKEVPAEAEIVSHQLMLRAGLIRRLASGLFTWMVVFFANDIGSRDKRIGISDVIGSRPLSVSQYVIARMIANTIANMKA